MKMWATILSMTLCQSRPVIESTAATASCVHPGFSSRFNFLVRPCPATSLFRLYFSAKRMIIVRFSVICDLMNNARTLVILAIRVIDGLFQKRVTSTCQWAYNMNNGRVKSIIKNIVTAAPFEMSTYNEQTARFCDKSILATKFWQAAIISYCQQYSVWFEYAGSAHYTRGMSVISYAFDQMLQATIIIS